MTKPLNKKVADKDKELNNTEKEEKPKPIKQKQGLFVNYKTPQEIKIEKKFAEALKGKAIL